MTNAKRDNNQITTIMGVLNTDGITPENVTIDPVTNILDVSDDVTGSSLGDGNAYRDNNINTTMMAVSSSDDSTPVSLYVDSSGNLLIDST